QTDRFHPLVGSNPLPYLDAVFLGYGCCKGFRRLLATCRAEPLLRTYASRSYGYRHRSEDAGQRYLAQCGSSRWF
ncbi:hypothetical protein D030_1750B, partial [Vibrio parahaemolyticus AQ3810]